MNQQDLQEVKRSFGRCLMSGDLFQEFYDIFLASDQRLKPMFINTDFEKQKSLLRHGVNLALMYAANSSTSSLAKLRKSHSKSQLNIPPSMYTLWVESFIKAIKNIDPQYEPSLDRKWRDTLRPAVEYMKAGYDEQ